MGRTIQTQKGKAKWYDLPLTEQEIERGNTIGEFEESSKDEQKSAYIRMHTPRSSRAHQTCDNPGVVASLRSAVDLGTPYIDAR